jgi:N-acetylgalactosamine-N,N'-diacetylbacillosaminyl-diphospho-undecaprenol 4-alpha-N-acetylgalactosaminyltransferase
MNETKIAILVYSLAGGGAERMVSYLLPYLQTKGIEVHLVLMNNNISYVIPKDIPIHYLEQSQGNENGFFKLIKLPFLAYKYAKLLNKLAISHSFSLLTRPSYINILSRYFTRKNYRLVISERSHPSMQYGYNNAQSSINNWLIKRLYPKADTIICNSRGNAEDLTANYGIAKEKIKVAHNPIDTEKIHSVAKLSPGFPDNYFNAITIGRMDQGKNHQLLIQTITDFPTVRLYILGSGSLEGYLKDLVTKLKLTDRVVFLGFDSNPFTYLKAADLFMFGSNHEGFPNVLLEALCCGLPILSTNCPSGPAEIMELKAVKTDDIMLTDYGILSPVGDISHFKKGLLYCLEHPKYLAKCRYNAQKRIKDFEREPILDAYTRHILAKT